MGRYAVDTNVAELPTAKTKQSASAVKGWPSNFLRELSSMVRSFSMNAERFRKNIAGNWIQAVSRA